MASIRLKVRRLGGNERLGKLYFRIIHHRESRQIGTGFEISMEEWDDRLSQIIIPHTAAAPRRRRLLSMQAQIEEMRQRLTAIVARLDNDAVPYSAAQVIEQFYSPRCSGEGFVAFARRLITKLEAVGKVAKAERYKHCVNRFAAFLGDRNDVPITQIDTDLMCEYESSLLAAGLCRNSISCYMRNLRAIYNLAVEEQQLPQRHPFTKVYTGVDKTRKRAIPMSDFARIRTLNLSADPSLAYSRDLLILLLLCQGMCFCDLAYLKKSDIKDGQLVYKRKKTGQRISVKWQPPMQAIVDRYSNPDSPYLLPIISDPTGNTRKQYRNALHQLNHNLKEVGRMAGIAIPLTSYVARHGWASNARSENIPIKVISQALGHESETTTLIYLMEIDTCEMDRANERMIRCLARETAKQRKLLRSQTAPPVVRKPSRVKHKRHSPQSVKSCYKHQSLSSEERD